MGNNRLSYNSPYTNPMASNSNILSSNDISVPNGLLAASNKNKDKYLLPKLYDANSTETNGVKKSTFTSSTLDKGYQSTAGLPDKIDYKALNPIDNSKVTQALTGEAVNTALSTGKLIAAAKAAKIAGTVAKAGEVATTASTTASAASTAATTAATAGEVATTGAGTAASAAGTTGAAASSVASGVATLGIGLAGTAIGVLGERKRDKALQTNNLKGYTWGQVANYGGKGLALGSSVGSLFGPYGTLIGGAIGLVGGAITGGVVGAVQKRKILRQRAADQAALDKIKNDITTSNRRFINQQTDVNNTNMLLNPNPMYKKGGLLLNYNTEIKSSADTKPTAKPVSLKNTPIIKLQNGGSVEDYLDVKTLSEKDQQSLMEAIVALHEEGKDEKAISKELNIHPELISNFIKSLKKASTPVFKSGGKMKGKKVKSCSCGCQTPKFRRGGKLDLNKENVILDGPSHDEFNNTGVKGDKGLPVVKITNSGKAIKVAEIESGELIINPESSEKIRKLKLKIESGDEKAKQELAFLLSEELKNNTYDYSNLM